MERWKCTRTRFKLPPSEPLAGGVPGVRVVITRCDEQTRLPPQPFEVFLDDNDLNIGVQSSSDIEQISANRRNVVRTRVRQQPVELLQAIVKVGNIFSFLESGGSSRFVRFHRRGVAGASRLG